MLSSTRKMMVVAVLACGLGLVMAPQAEAGWWWGHSYSWGYGGYVSPWYTPVYSYTPCCSVSVCDPCCSYGSWYAGLRPGPVRRFLFGPYRWYWNPGCCSVCYADPCCCYDGGTVVSMDSSPSVSHEAQKPTLAPAQQPAPAPAAPDPQSGWSNPPAGSSPSAPTPPAPGVNESTIPAEAGASAKTTEGTISILVPEDAQVAINGYVTKSTGRVRRYVSQNLKPGLVYPFEIRVSVVREGRVVTQSQRVNLTGGALEAVVFDFAQKAVEGIARNM